MAYQNAMFMLPSTYSQGVGDLTIRNFGANSLSLVLRPTNALSTLHHVCSLSIEKSAHCARLGDPLRVRLYGCGHSRPLDNVRLTAHVSLRAHSVHYQPTHF